VLSDLAPDIRKVIDRRGDLTKQMTQIFIEGQQEQDILRRLFTALPSLSKLDILRRHRVRVREPLPRYTILRGDPASLMLVALATFRMLLRL
jgi:hypothetical protein